MRVRDYCRYDSKTKSYVLYRWIETKGMWEISKKIYLQAKETSDEQLKEAIAEHVPEKEDLRLVVFEELQTLKTEQEKLNKWAARKMITAFLEQ